MQAFRDVAKFRARVLTILLPAATVFLLCSPVPALEPGEFLFKWDGARYSLEARDARMTDILADIEATTGIPIYYDESEPAVTTQSIQHADLERLMRVLAENVLLTYVRDSTQPEGYRVESVSIDASVADEEKARIRARQAAQPSTPSAAQPRTPIKYSGVGARILYTADRKGIQFRPIVDHAPITRAGIGPEDIVLAVDGEPVASFRSLAALSKVIRGPQGTPVSFSVLTPDGTIREQRAVRDIVEYRAGRPRR